MFNNRLKALLIGTGCLIGGMVVLAACNEDARRQLYGSLGDLAGELKTELVMTGVVYPAFLIRADGIAKAGARLISGLDLW